MVCKPVPERAIKLAADASGNSLSWICLLNDVLWSTCIRACMCSQQSPSSVVSDHWRSGGCYIVALIFMCLGVIAGDVNFSTNN